MVIEFSGEAGDAYNTTLAGMAGWTVEVEVEHNDGEAVLVETFELVGPDYDAQWYGSIKVRKWSDAAGEGVGDPFTVVAAKVTVL
jgi:hypothetical protein